MPLDVPNHDFFDFPDLPDLPDFFFGIAVTPMADPRVAPMASIASAEIRMPSPRMVKEV